MISSPAPSPKIEPPFAERQRRFPDSLRGRLLVVLAGFVVVVAAGTAAVQYVEGRRLLTASVERRIERDAGGVADRIARRARDVSRAAALWPGLEAAQDVATDDVDKRFSTTLASLARALELDATAVAADTAGRIVAASSVSMIGRPLARVPGVVRGEASTRLALVATPRGEWRLVAGAPILARATGRVIGRLVLSVPWRVVVASAAPPVDPAAVAIDAADGAPLWRGAAFAAQEPLLLGRVARDSSGLALRVTVGEARGVALAPVREGERATLVLAAIILAVALPAAALFARGTTRSLVALSRSALAVDSAGHAALVAPDREAPREVRVLHGALATMLVRQEEARRALADREVLASLGTMAAALAHEIRTPLAVVHGSAEMLGRGVDDGKRQELVALVTDETRRLERLVDDLLAFARPRPVLLGDLDLAAVGRRAADVLGDHAARHGVTLALALERAPARGDPEQLQQVVLNLANNAVQLTRSGGTVTLASRPAAADDAGAVIEVRDQGPGIPAEARERIWTPFFTTRRGGTGLGLAIVKRIVDAHGGRVDVECPAAGGTIMRVVIPSSANGRP